MPMPFAAKALFGALVATAAAGGAWALSSDEGAGAAQTTDDAYVQADFSTVAPKTAGLVAQVLVEDNQPVRRGQLLVAIDDRDQRLALASAEADLGTAQARVDGLRHQLSRQDLLISQAAAVVDADAAAITLSQANARRYRSLAADGSASRQEQQEAASRLVADQAAQRRDAAGHAAAQAQVPILQAGLADAQAAMARAQAAVDAARLALSYTQVRAPIDGIVGQRTVRPGNYVQVGAPLLAVVPLQQAYVEARFREAQLGRIRPGQRATVTVDALPGTTLSGHVDSIAPATGVSFAAIAPENATGNFTKIAQRFVVRIAVDPDQAAAGRLRVGMSAVPTVRTDR